LGQEAKEHALLALRLSPRDFWISGNAQLALAMASYSAREYTEAVRWAEMAIQSASRAPIRRAIMIACCAWAGDLQRAAQERAVLDGFAPGFIRQPVPRREPGVHPAGDMEHLLHACAWRPASCNELDPPSRRDPCRRCGGVFAADGADEEGTLERLKALRRELLDPTIAEHRGRIVKTTGDGMLVEFASVVDAGAARFRCSRRCPSGTTASRRTAASSCALASISAM